MSRGSYRDNIEVKFIRIMHRKIITITLLGALCSQADVLTSTRRFFGMGGQIPPYTDDIGEVEPTVIGQAPYSPADSDLGVQSILVPRGESEPLIFVLDTSLSRIDNAPSGNPATDTDSWISSSSMSLTWRSHLVHGWFADLGVSQDLIRYDRTNALDFESLNLRYGVYKSLASLDDTVFFARYEYQRLTFTSLSDEQYSGHRIRTGVLKTLWEAPGQQLTGGLSAAFEKYVVPSSANRDEYVADLAYHYSFTNSLSAVGSLSLARSCFDKFGREDWTYSTGLDLVWQINSDFIAKASVSYDRNDSNVFGNANEYQSWTAGAGLGLQWSF